MTEVCRCNRIIIIIINLIYIAQFDTKGILTALYIVITYIHNVEIQACFDLFKKKKKNLSEDCTCIKLEYHSL